MTKYVSVSISEDLKDRLDYWKRKGNEKSINTLIDNALEFYIKAYNHDSLNNDAVMARLNQLISESQAQNQTIDVLRQSMNKGFDALFGFEDESGE